MKILNIAVALSVLAAGTQAHAGAREKCSAAKMKAASKYAACRLAADSKSKSTGDPADYTKCVDGLSKSWAKAEAKYTTDCPTTGDFAALQADLTAAASCVATGLSTAGACDTSAEFLCGNGVVDAGEDCDQSALDGETCASATSGAQNFGVLGCAADCQDFDTSGCIACPADGVVVEGQCWILGPLGESCNTACSLESMATDDAVLDMHAYTASRCAWILDKLGATSAPPGALVNGPTQIGCYLQSVGGPPRVAYSCTQAGAYANAMRLCACQ
jgi:hypothetical protein